MASYWTTPQGRSVVRRPRSGKHALNACAGMFVVGPCRTYETLVASTAWSARYEPQVHRTSGIIGPGYRARDYRGGRCSTVC